MKSEFVKTFPKGKELGADFNKFIMESLIEVTSQKQEGAFAHDIVVRFKKRVKLSITFETL